MNRERRCEVGVVFGPESYLYSFPGGHPMNSGRLHQFDESLRGLAESSAERTTIMKPSAASEDELALFHTSRYIDQVKELSSGGEGYLDFPDTPVFPDVYQASLYTVGGTLECVRTMLDGTYDHCFNPVGGLHHAGRDRASGFCIFNDAGVAIERLLRSGVDRVAYIDIDAHHGDGVYYAFESDPRVIIADIHEDGRTLFPGTGSESERGKGSGEGTKLNLPLPSGAEDQEFFAAFERAYRFVEVAKPQFILLQCGADGLAGDPLTHLRYSAAAHSLAASRLHELAHQLCGGHILAMGGGGYSSKNVNSAWTAVVRSLSTWT